MQSNVRMTTVDYWGTYIAYVGDDCEVVTGEDCGWIICPSRGAGVGDGDQLDLQTSHHALQCSGCEEIITMSDDLSERLGFW